MFQRVPADKLGWKLTESSFTLGQQLGHIPGALLFFAGVLNWEQQRVKSLREIFLVNRRQPSLSVAEGLAHLERSIAGFKSAVRKAGEQRFQTEMLQTRQFGQVVFWRYCFFCARTSHPSSHGIAYLPETARNQGRYAYALQRLGREGISHNSANSPS